MLKRLLQSLGLAEKPKPRRRMGPRPSAPGSKHKRCRNCKALLPPAAFRCAACGARLLQKQGSAAAEAGAAEAVDPEGSTASAASTPKIGDLERRILNSAAADNTKRIVTLDASGVGTGEVKAGNDRYEGNDALEAIRVLLRSGYIAEWGDGTYAITPEGQTLVASLS